MRGWTRTCADCGETITQFGRGRPRKWCAACCQANYRRRRVLYALKRRERALVLALKPRKPRARKPRCTSCLELMVLLPADGLCGACRVRWRAVKAARVLA